jgi:hypothetical protein
MATTAAAQEAVHLRELLEELNAKQEGPTIIKVDNQACIMIAKNPGLHKRTKHIDIKYHFIRQAIEAEQIQLEYVNTEDNCGDILTKPLSKEHFERHKNKMLQAPQHH